MGSTANKTTIAMGILSVFVGVIPLLAMAGVLPHGSASADAAPSWMGWLIGAMFVGAGLIVIMKGALNPDDHSGALPAGTAWPLRLAHDTIAIGIVCALALSFSWVAFGPGPRHFSMGINGLWLPLPGDTFGRVAFGFGAVLLWCMTGAFAVATLRAWRRQPSIFGPASDRRL